MSRRPARITQTEIDRALKSASRLGGGWGVEIEGDILRIIPVSHKQLAVDTQPAPMTDDDDPLMRGLARLNGTKKKNRRGPSA